MARWGPTSFYDNGSVVVGSNGLPYVSQVDQNVGHDPTTDATNWHTVDIATSTVIAGLAPLASPTFTGLVSTSGQAVSQDATYAAAKGPVIHDKLDGHTYRLVSTSGALSTEAVT